MARRNGCGQSIGRIAPQPGLREPGEPPFEPANQNNDMAIPQTAIIVFSPGFGRPCISLASLRCRRPARLNSGIPLVQDLHAPQPHKTTIADPTGERKPSECARRGIQAVTLRTSFPHACELRLRICDLNRLLAVV